MGVLDFLFEGSAPPNTNTSSSSVQNLPSWLSDYTQALLARANQVAGEGYQAYSGPRVAGTTTDQANAWDIIRNNIGGWNDDQNKAEDMAGGALSQSMPFLGQGASAISGSMATTPSQIKDYMDPYVGNVIDRAKTEALRTWNEDLMPQISGRFISGGQSGSTAHQDRLTQGARDVAEGINQQALAALSPAYQVAGQQAQSDLTRKLQAGEQLGALGQTIGNLNISGGQLLGNLAQQQQSLGMKDAGALEAVGATQQAQNQKNLDLAYQDFQNQVNYPKEMTSWMTGLLQNMPHDQTTTDVKSGPANVYQPSPLSQLLSLYGVYKDVTSARGGLIGDNKYAEGGPVEHIAGPIAGYARYAEGGKAGKFGQLLQQLLAHHRAGDQQGAMDLLEAAGQKHGIPDLHHGYWQAESNEDAIGALKDATDRLQGMQSPRRAMGLMREMMSGYDPDEQQMMKLHPDYPTSDSGALQFIQDVSRDNPTRAEVLGNLDDYRRRVPSIKKMQPKVRKAQGGALFQCMGGRI